MKKIEPKIDDHMNRILGKRRGTPDIRIQEYIELQHSPEVRNSLRALVKGHDWCFITFKQFMGSIHQVASSLFTRLAKKRNPICFIIDGLHKSSFWVFALIMRMPQGEALLKRQDVWLAVDNEDMPGGLRNTFQTLPDNTIHILLDDAVYSGDQLSSFYKMTVNDWKETHANKTPAETFIVVPYISLQAIRIFKNASVLTVSTFKPLFFRRKLKAVMGHDLFLERKHDVMFTQYQSLYFDFLGIQPTNTLMLFEHKFADALSIPHRWLHTGPCVPPGITVAYRVKPSRIDELTDMIEREIKTTGIDVIYHYAHISPPIHRDAARKVADMMHSPKFRKEYMDKLDVSMPTAAAHTHVKYFPLLSPEYCEPQYRRFVARQLSSGATSPMYLHIPDCRKPPYKRESFKGRVPLVESIGSSW